MLSSNLPPHCVQKQDLVYDPDTPGGLLRTNKAVGLWTELRPAQLYYEGETHAVTVKSYRRSVSNMHLFTVENHIR